jgi:CBS domain containing-hemolysin-like protein
MSIAGSLLATVVLLAANAFFVGAEFGLISARRDRLEALAKEGRTRAGTAIRAGQQLPLMIAGAQLGITLCSLALGALAEPAIAHLIEVPLEPLHIPAPVLHGVAFTLALGIVVTLHIVLGEMVPKNLAIAGPERAAMWLVPVHFAFCRLVRPVLGAFTAISRGALRILGVTPKDELDTAYTRDELAELISESSREGLLQDSEHRRLTQTLSTADRTVRDVLVPLDRLTTVPAAPSVGDVARAVADTGYSRFPIRDGAGTLLGYLHVKDVLDVAGEDPSTPVPADRFRALPDLPDDARLDTAMAILRRTNSHLGRAICPDGTVCGVVALEDVVEEYVGRIMDGTHRANGG